jgi:trehalose 6-phosphate synthase
MGEALIVNPFDSHEVAEAIRTALAMPKSERIRRFEKLYAVIATTDIDWWTRQYLAALSGNSAVIEAPVAGGARKEPRAGARRANRGEASAASSAGPETGVRKMSAGSRRTQRAVGGSHLTLVRP